MLNCKIATLGPWPEFKRRSLGLQKPQVLGDSVIKGLGSTLMTSVIREIITEVARANENNPEKAI